ncbi:MAG: hypothetical protein QNJ15_02085 [Erythrobacter sp.]|nr:hypothetical protein [Erythrobacter sp.]
MTTISEGFRNTGFRHRANAYKERAEASKLGADLYDFSRTFPGDYGQELRDIFNHLDDAAMASKARKLSDNMREAFARMASDAWTALGPNPDAAAIEEFGRHLAELQERIDMLRELAGRLEAAAALDKASDAMMEVADAFVEMGQ